MEDKEHRKETGNEKDQERQEAIVDTIAGAFSTVALWRTLHLAHNETRGILEALCFVYGEVPVDSAILMSIHFADQFVATLDVFVTKEEVINLMLEAEKRAKSKEQLSTRIGLELFNQLSAEKRTAAMTAFLMRKYPEYAESFTNLAVAFAIDFALNSRDRAPEYIKDCAREFSTIMMDAFLTPENQKLWMRDSVLQIYKMLSRHAL